MTPADCPHETFTVRADVNRLTDGEGAPLTALSVELAGECADCGSPIVWHCDTVGLSFRGPAVSPNGQELRAPARLAVHPADFGLQLPGFTVNAHAPTSPN